MLRLKSKKVKHLWIGSQKVATLWVAASRRTILKVFDSIRSCFGSGRWVPSKPWLSAERWKSHP